MYALPEESRAMEVYWPTYPELSTVVVTHDPDALVAYLRYSLL